VSHSSGLRDWLLEGDPSVRYLVLRDLLDRPEDDPDLRSARRQIGRKGWAAEILRRQMPNGQWDTPNDTAADLYLPKYIATNWRLIVLSDLGVTRRDPRVARAVRLFLRRMGGPRGGFGGRGSEVCFTGNSLRFLVRLGYEDLPEISAARDWLLRHQKRDGGWHCFPSRTGTLDGWEALAAFAALPGNLRTTAVEESIRRGAEFYLDRGLLREGRGDYAPWSRLHYPVHYYYDLLVGLDTLTALGYGGDRRIRPAVRRLERMRDSAGRWKLDALHPDFEGPSYRIRTPFYPFGLEQPGRPSRWITLTALRVLKRVAA